jgi:hypothetical protein
VSLGDPQVTGATTATPRRPTPGQAVLVTLGLAVGLLLMAIQLWLLTLAFDLYRAGERRETVGVAAGSGLIFLGGLVMWRVLDRQPDIRRLGRWR